MATYSVTFLSRDDNGRFKRRHERLPAHSHEEVESYVRHGHRHGKWHIEGDITVRGPEATNSCETVTFPCS